MKTIKNLALVALCGSTISASAYSGIYHKQIQKTKFRTVNNSSFTVGEKLTYRFHYGPMDAAEAELEVKETAKTINGRPLLHVVGRGKSISSFDWFFKVRDRYESYIDQKGVFPWIFIRRVYEGGFEINQDYTFYQHKKVVNTGKEKVTAPANVQDMISAFYYARTLDYDNAKKGDTFTIDCIVDGEVWPLKIKYLGKDEVKIRKGKFKCIRFAPVVQEGRIWKDEDDLQVWITDDENKIPLLAKTKIAVGSIKMELTKYEGLKAPISKI